MAGEEVRYSSGVCLGRLDVDGRGVGGTLSLLRVFVVGFAEACWMDG